MTYSDADETDTNKYRVKLPGSYTNSSEFKNRTPSEIYNTAKTAVKSDPGIVNFDDMSLQDSVPGYILKLENSVKTAVSKEANNAKDETQRLHKPYGLTEGAGDVPIEPYSMSRPKYGRTQINDVWNAHTNPETGTITDPSGSMIVWDRTKSQNGQWDMGHIPGQNYSNIHEKYMHGEISLDEFLEWYRNPQNYRPELPQTNRSHLYEDNWPYLK